MLRVFSARDELSQDVSVRDSQGKNLSERAIPCSLFYCREVP